MGQITLNTTLGKHIYHLCRTNNNINTVIEIGTWDGDGTTRCVISGLKDSEKSNISFVSYETNKMFYDKAVLRWNDDLPSWAKFVYGRLIDVCDMDTENLTSEERHWFKEDMSWYSECPKVTNSIPEKIDLTILDGGEFSTKAEFFLLLPKTKMFILDDTRSRKCKWIRGHVLDNPHKYEVHLDEPHDRNGIMSFSVI